MKLEPIDTSTTAGKARVMQLAAEGRKVAYLGRSSAYREGIWNSADSPTWDWDRFDFAIIAQPVVPDEVWFEMRDDGKIYSIYMYHPADSDISVVRYRRVEE